MKDWTLHIVIKHFDDFLKDVDFAHLPSKESEDYRHLVLKTANDVIFSEGRYSQITEWTMELFDIPEVCALLRNLSAINQLSDAERVRLAFYQDVKEVCYPLFRGQKVDWSAWPWQLNDGRSSFENKELFALITQGDSLMGQPLPNLCAAMLYDLKQLMWMNDEQLYSSVACNEASQCYDNTVASAWNKQNAPADDENALMAAVGKCADDLWAIENHTLVGQLMGFDLLTQSVYDSFDTYIDPTYRHNQVLCARELAAWLRKHWTIGERHPAEQLVSDLYTQWQRLMAEYDVTTPDERYAWNILTLDVLGMAMFSPEQEEGADDEEDWAIDDSLTS